jgi:hypothetical protein
MQSHCAGRYVVEETGVPASSLVIKPPTFFYLASTITTSIILSNTTLEGCFRVFCNYAKKIFTIPFFSIYYVYYLHLVWQTEPIFIGVSRQELNVRQRCSFSLDATLILLNINIVSRPFSSV